MTSSFWSPGIKFAIAITLWLYCSTIVGAVTVSTQSGSVYDLNLEQVENLKRQPGIYYFQYNPDRIVKDRVSRWEMIGLPEALGGGFLTGTAENFNTALNTLGIAPLAAQPEAQEALTGTETEEMPPAATAAGEDRRERFAWEWRFDTGYRVDQLNWNKAHPSGSPNVLSELTWEDLEIFQLRFGLSALFFQNLKVKGTFAYGFIFDGQNQDSDYLGDDRTQEFSRSNNATDSGETLDASIGVSYVFSFLTDKIAVTPLIGYSYHLQYLSITDGVQTLETPGITPPLGPFPGLDSNYDARWQGFWFGLDTAFRIFRRDGVTLAHEFILGGEYHWDADYYGVGNWNLRSDLEHPKSFEHRADGQGYILTGEYRFYLTRKWSLNLNGNYQKWDTDPGSDKMFFSDGTTAMMQLNEVNWESWAVMFGVNCQF